MKLTKSLLAATFAFTAIANAQETNKFSLSGEFRPRTELFGHGQQFTSPVGATPTVNTSVRAALNAKYTTDSYTAYLGVQEVFSFGDRPQIAASGNDNLRIQEAWADVKLGEGLSLKIGRQPLSYDDQRILGGLGWAQQARTHDGAILKYKVDGYSFDLGGSLSSTDKGTSIYNTSALFSYRDMGFLRINKKFGDLNLSLLGLVTTFQNGSANKAALRTGGIHADYSAGIVKLSANFYAQGGDRIFPAGQEIDGAYLASLDAVIKATDKISILAGGEIISGADEDKGTKGFFPLYGTNHKFNGLMDRFYVGNHANAGGLVDLNIGIATKIGGYAVKLKGHYFQEAEDVNTVPGPKTGAVGLDGKDLGTELDLVVAKKFNGFKLVGGYSQFFEPSEVSGAKSTQNWAWLMLIIKPKFL